MPLLCGHLPGSGLPSSCTHATVENGFVSSQAAGDIVTVTISASDTVTTCGGDNV